MFFCQKDGNSPNWLQIELEVPSTLNQYAIIFEANSTAGILLIPLGGISIGIFLNFRCYLKMPIR